MLSQQLPVSLDHKKLSEKDRQCGKFRSDMVASKGPHVGSGDANLWVTRGPGLLWLGVDDRPSSWLSLSPAGVFDVYGAKPNLKAKLSCLSFMLLLLPRNVCVLLR